MSSLTNILSLLTGRGVGYQIQKSLRFNSADTAYLNRTPASAGNRTVYTIAFWMKRTKLAVDGMWLFRATSDASNYTECYFSSNDKLNFQNVVSGSANTRFVTTQVFRDPSAWYHLVFSINGSTAVKLYVNGTEVTTFDSTTGPGASNHQINNTVSHTIGRNAGSDYADLYLSDFHLIDGQALDPTSFGEFDANTGVWNPKGYIGTYGTNGFHLPFSDNSSAAALGTDTSGNGNDWTVNNISVGSGIDYSAYTSASGGFNASYPKTNLFNGTITSANRAEAATADVPIEIDFSSVPGGVSVSTTLSIWSGKSTVAYQINNSGSYTTYTGAVETWKDISFSGTLTNLKIKHGAAGEAAGASGIRIDGAILVDTGRNLDSLVDVPTNYGIDTGVGGEVRGNYCTWNPLNKGANMVLLNGNLDIATTTGTSAVTGTTGVSSGKWYWEMTITGANDRTAIGIAKAGMDLTDMPGDVDALGWSYYADGGTKRHNATSTAYGASFTNGDTVAAALDLDAGTITFYKNGVSQGTAFTGLSGEFFPAAGDGSGVNNANSSTNFGQRQFAYQAPEGFKALCTANLPAPVITKPSTVMDVNLYTGNGSTQTISGLEFSPDLVWIKGRDATPWHAIFDAVRGTGLRLSSNVTNAETGNGSTDLLQSFNSDGFTVNTTLNGSPDTSVNWDGSAGGASSYVAWTWDAGSSTVTNEDGSITSSVRANPSAGFSIVTWTGTGVAGTVGHGCGAAPSMVIVKPRDEARDWIVGHSSLGDWNYFLYLNLTNAKDGPYSTVFGGTAPTSTVFSIGTSGYVNTTGNGYVAYCFAPVAGYSSFGSYTGNGSATNGPFVYTGFRPRWVLLKNAADAGNNWWVIDSARSSYNVQDAALFPNSSIAENNTTAVSIDFLSNGFKCRTSDGGQNPGTGSQVIYAAFAEHPFQYARAR